MKLLSLTECLIYPGKMTSFIELKLPFKKISVKPISKKKMRILQSKDIWEILIEFPGIAKKDISAKIKDRQLLICAPSKSLNGNENENENDWYEQQIELPNDADILFTTAQFINGVLKIIIPRTDKPDTINIDHVAIY